MKNIILLMTIMFSFSCANQGFFSSNTTPISDRGFDILAKESFIRYSEPRLEALKSIRSYGAIAKCHSGNTKDGLEELKGQYNKRRTDPEYWNNIGTCYYLKGELNKSKYYFNTALNTAKARGQNFAPALNNLAVMYLKLRHYEMAYKNLIQARRLAPNSLTPIFNLSQFYLSFGEFNKAHSLLISLYQRNPKDVDVLSSLGTLYLFKKEYNTSISYFGKISKEFLVRQDIATHYAMSLYQVGDYERAINLIKASKSNEITNFEQASKELESLIEKKLDKLEEVKERTAELRQRG